MEEMDKKWNRRKSEEIMAKNSPKLMHDTKRQITKSRDKAKENHIWAHLVKMLEGKRKM